MHLTNLFKSLIYIMTIACLTACLYFCSVLLFTGVIVNYNKASWYYGYNQVSLDASLNEAENQYPQMIGFKDDESIFINEDKVELFKMKDYSIDLIEGHQINNDNEIIISQAIANQLLENDTTDQTLIGQTFNNYIICGITKIEMENPYFAFANYRNSDQVKGVIFTPDTDMEKLQKDEAFALQNHDQVFLYVKRIIKALDIGVILIILLLAIDLILSKIGRFNFKKTVIYNILASVASTGLIYLINNQLNPWLSNSSYLQFGLMWEHLIIPLIFILLLNLGIKKIKFFN